MFHLIPIRKKVTLAHFGSLPLCVGHTCVISKAYVLVSLGYYTLAQVGRAKAMPHTRPRGDS
jgi:hypothetical protein